MRWQTSRRSGNIEDRRGMSAGVATGGIGGLGLVIVLLVSIVTGQNPLELLQIVSQQGPSEPAPVNTGPAAKPGQPGYDERRDFVDAVLGSTEDAWTRVFASTGRRYEPPTLVLFEQAVNSACGMASAAVGPFYCPGDRKVYLDLSFFRELDQRFGAPGDFAQAYVIAHEVGHHVQTLLGTSERVHAARERAGEAEANALSVRMELQADCYAGIWGHHAGQQSNLIEEGDIEEGLAAAAAIGDDRLQRRGRGTVSPESWTHGSSAQRAEWLRRGLQSGRVEACDTFATR